jgi:hypothetical protein
MMDRGAQTVVSVKWRTTFFVLPKLVDSLALGLLMAAFFFESLVFTGWC